MDAVVRGPNLPPRVVGSLQGYFNVCLKNCVLERGKQFDTIRIVLWGLPTNEVPHVRVPKAEESCTVVCPVVTEWLLFEEYLRQAKGLMVELGKRSVIWKAAVDISLPLPESQIASMAKSVSVVDEFGEERGTVDVICWSDVPTPRVIEDNNKRRRVILNRLPDTVIDSIADVFDVLEKRMSSQGLRLIDVFRFCNKLNTPVADMTPLIDRYVDRGVPVMHRNQFWELIDWKGSRIFTFADFNQRFKNAKRAMQTIRSGIKMEVAVTSRFDEVYRDLTRIEPHEQQRYTEVNSKILIEHLRRCAPNCIAFDECCLLATLFLELPKQNTWTFEEIRSALKIKPKRKETTPKPAVLSRTLYDHPSGGDDASEEQSSEQSERSDAQGSGSSESNSVREEHVSPEDSEKAQDPTNAEGTSQKGTAPQDNQPPNQSREDGTKLNVLQSVINTIEPIAPETTVLTEGIMSSSVDRKENVMATLDGLISKCQGIVRDMSSCAQALCASQRDLDEAPRTLPLILCHQDTLSFSSNQRMTRQGLSDDPGTLVEDVLYDALVLQEQHPATDASNSLAFIDRMKSSQTAMGSNCGSSACAGNPADGKATEKWIQLVLHQLQVETSWAEPYIVVKTKSFTKKVEREDWGIEVGLLIPFSSNVAIVHLIVEVWSHCNTSTKECLLGIVKLGISMTTADCMPKHAVYPIIDLCGKERGSLALSLAVGVQRLMIPRTAQVGKRPLLGVSERQCGLGQQKSEEERLNERGGIRTANSSSDAVSASKNNHTMEVDNAEVKKHVHVQEDERLIEESTSREIVHITVFSLKLVSPTSRCLISCSLEEQAATEYRSATVDVMDVTSVSISTSFQHSFSVPEKGREQWFDQSLVFKVLSVSEEDQTETTIGEMHLDMSCLLRFGRVCGPMGILDWQLKKTGEIEIEVQLSEADGDHSSQDHHASGIHPKNPGASVPLQTCSDDENYVVIGGVDGELLSPRSDNIDALCDLLMQSTDLEQSRHSDSVCRVPAAAVYDPFYCDDDFMLDISKTADRTAGTEDAMCQILQMDNAAAGQPIGSAGGEASDDSIFDTEGEISVQRVSSDCLGKSDSKEKWRFTTALPVSPSSSPVLYSDFLPSRSTCLDDAQIAHHPSCTADSLGELMCPSKSADADEVALSDGNDSKESVDIDDLLKKYNIERRPGWWKSLMSEASPSEGPQS